MIHATIAELAIITKYYTQAKNVQQRLHTAQPNQQDQQQESQQEIQIPAQDQTGLQVYVDAAIQKINLHHAPRKAGLGIHIQGQVQGRQLELLIQATHPQAQDPLHAETLVLELASKIIQKLAISRTVYHTDSHLLASNVNSQESIMLAPDWRIRPSLSQFISNNVNIQYSCKKIPREENKTAHTLAKFAWRSSLSSANYTCINSLHFLSKTKTLFIVTDGQFNWLWRNCFGMISIPSL